MRVTKTIREYVESEVNKKFAPLLDGIGVEYKKRRDDAEAIAEEFVKNANAELIKILKGLDMYDPGFYQNVPIRLNNGVIGNSEMSHANGELRNKIKMRRENTIQDILLGLELGETTRNTLREALDSIDTDVE